MIEILSSAPPTFTVDITVNALTLACGLSGGIKKWIPVLRFVRYNVVPTIEIDGFDVQQAQRASGFKV